MIYKSCFNDSYYSRYNDSLSARFLTLYLPVYTILKTLAMFVDKLLAKMYIDLSWPHLTSF